ncbi:MULTISPECIES: cryptochrome/photolyase family protein [Paenibacillus]|uniref:cryptochrome/photolyase family protein n=1 Tax=Paenibacillus TaxID=44249 RepID=UPI0022B90C67|nr:deoxyribodipyrimidine photo-lyase [Paenibacillus caseinilyticus]MCZ8522941.1 deoxyribodipyrimidine photo-lyase [Paenibacillus caseinilyticus]
MILFLHRKDLRTDDLPAYDYIAESGSGSPSLHVLVLDPFLLRKGRHLEHSGRNFLAHAARLQSLYDAAGQHLHVLYGEPAGVTAALLEAHGVRELVFHEDYTPYAVTRDRSLRETAAARGVRVTGLAEQTLADLRDFQHSAGRSEPYKVYTPYYRRWREYLREHFRPASTRGLGGLRTLPLAEGVASRFPLPEELAQALADSRARPAAEEPEAALEDFLGERLAGYAEGRERFAREETSRLSRHLNTGALSIRRVYEQLLECGTEAEPWLRQLAWRDFYLYQSRLDPLFYRYEKEYDLTELPTDGFHAWAEARTGIPIIDAAMTELNATGWMPNRLRMITAMFLTKNLLCPFPYGERYFRSKLADYDNALNRGGWLWSASLGYDAAPYFRVMNPVTQSQTYDPGGSYIRRWLPELAGLSDKEIHLPRPDAVVDLKASRALSIDVYKGILARRADAGAERGNPAR